MLALFKDDTKDQFLTPPVIPWARTQWRKQLDKGNVSVSSLEESWLKEYPHNEESIPLVREWGELLTQHRWLMTDQNVREIFAHHAGLIEAVGDSRTTFAFPLEEVDWDLWIETLAIQIGAEYNFSRPCTSSYWRFQDSPWRVTLLHSSMAPGSPAKVFLRKLSATPYALENYAADASVAQLLRDAITSHENVLVAGPTGSGKTSFLSTLLQQHDDQEHLVVLEDTREISCDATRLTRLLANEHSGRSLSDLLAHTLRLSPDRIVLGEMRSHEVVPYLLAMNTGHRGVMGTLHASSAPDALHRVAQLFSLASGRKEMNYHEVLRLVCRNVGLVVFLEKRKIKEVIRVFGSEEGQPLFDCLWRG